jgi:hypothetical protein
VPRSPGLTPNATAGTGTSRRNPRQQDNTTRTYLNAFAVYGGTNERLDWLHGRMVTITGTRGNAGIPPGGGLGGIAFTATWDNVANARPPNFSLNNQRCATAEAPPPPTDDGRDDRGGKRHDRRDRGGGRH